MEEKRQDVIQKMQEAGLPAWIADMNPEKLEGSNPSSVGTLNLSEKRTQDEIKNGVELSLHETHRRGVFLTGQCAGAITDIKPANEIIEEMVQQAVEQIHATHSLLSRL